jgi:hypothetical protein
LLTADPVAGAGMKDQLFLAREYAPRTRHPRRCMGLKSSKREEDY